MLNIIQELSDIISGLFKMLFKHFVYRFALVGPILYKLE